MRKEKKEKKAVSVEPFWPVQMDTGLLISFVFQQVYCITPLSEENPPPGPTRIILQGIGVAGLQQSTPLELLLVAMAEVKNDQGIAIRSNQTRNLSRKLRNLGMILFVWTRANTADRENNDFENESPWLGKKIRNSVLQRMNNTVNCSGIVTIKKQASVFN